MRLVLVYHQFNLTGLHLSGNSIISIADERMQFQ
jgi:hypothetical protein